MLVLCVIPLRADESLQGAEAKEAAKAQFRALLVRMDAAYALTAVKNAEIRFHWHIVRPSLACVSFILRLVSFAVPLC